MISIRYLVCVLALSAAWPTQAEQALVAVATNFAEVAGILARDYENSCEHRITLATGSTGKLYAQIVNGAPYDVFLAADSERPMLLEKNGDAVAGTRRVYAAGRLTLWSPDAEFVSGDGREILRKDVFDSLAIANPKLAPYGAAAKQMLQSLELWDSMESRIVMGENVGQVYALVATRSVALGLVALSTVNSPRNALRGSRWDVPASLHAPIRQELVLLQRGKDNAAATGFLEFLQTEHARATIVSFGYLAE